MISVRYYRGAAKNCQTVKLGKTTITRLHAAAAAALFYFAKCCFKTYLKSEIICKLKTGTYRYIDKKLIKLPHLALFSYFES